MRCVCRDLSAMLCSVHQELHDIRHQQNYQKLDSVRYLPVCKSSMV